MGASGVNNYSRLYTYEMALAASRHFALIAVALNFVGGVEVESPVRRHREQTAAQKHRDAWQDGEADADHADEADAGAAAYEGTFAIMGYEKLGGRNCQSKNGGHDL